MSKVYQRLKGDASSVPHNIYLVCLYLLKDEARIADEIVYPPEVPVDNHYREMSRITVAIIDAYNSIPEEAYRKALRKHFIANEQIRFLAPKYNISEKTLSRWKSWLIYAIAKNLNLI